MAKIRINDKDIHKTDITYFALRGRLTDCSTRELHTHLGEHQFLVIRRGLSLLVDSEGRKPLYGRLCALLPAGCAHRSLVVGDQLEYQSLYVEAPSMEAPGAIAIFGLGDLGWSLFDRIADRSSGDEDDGILPDAVSLFLKVALADARRAIRPLLLPEPRDELGRRVVEFFEAHYGDRLGLDDLGRAVGLSPRQLERRFSAATGMGLFSYLRLYRIFVASTMLVDPGVTVLAAAEACGYDSPSAFYGDFREVFGATPGAFRSAASGAAGSPAAPPEARAAQDGQIPST